MSGPLRLSIIGLIGSPRRLIGSPRQGCQVLHGRWRTAGGLGGLASRLADLADWRTLPGGLGGLADLADSGLADLADWRTRVWRTLADSGQALADPGGLSWSWRTLADLADSDAISSGMLLARSSVQSSCQVILGHNSQFSSVSSVQFSQFSSARSVQSVQLPRVRVGKIYRHLCCVGTEI